MTARLSHIDARSYCFQKQERIRNQYLHRIKGCIEYKHTTNYMKDGGREVQGQSSFRDRASMPRGL